MMLTLLLLALLCTIVSGNRAIATLLSGSPDNAEKYTRLLHSFVYSLRNAGYDDEIVVLYADDFPIDAEKLSHVLNVKTKAVEKITVQHTDGKGNPHYASMLTKLHLWNLLEYSQVMYYDCDFVFQQNPAPAFSECSWSSLCATPDTGIHNFNKAIRPGTYFNAGFLVLRPNAATYADLMAKQHLATNKFFVEQDLLNEVYKGKWGQLDQKYNLTHCYQLQAIRPNIVAIHEKMWVLRKSFPEQHYIWNSSKMRVNYPVTSLLTLPTNANKKAENAKSKAPAAKPSAKMWLNAKLSAKQTVITSDNGGAAINGQNATASNDNKAARADNAVNFADLLQRKDKKLFSYKREDNEARTMKLLKTFQEREAELLPPNIAINNPSPRNYKIAHKSISEPRKRPKIVRNRSPQWA